MYLTIGKILKPQGIKGEVKALSLTDDPDRFNRLKKIFVGDIPQTITAVRVGGNFVFLKFAGIDSANAAETLRGKEIKIKRKDAPALPEGKYYISDIVGMTLADENSVVLGKITAVDAFGAADVITFVRPNGGEARFPFVERAVKEVDINSRTMIVFAERFAEVCVYED